jgi:hypothetical protein
MKKSIAQIKLELLKADGGNVPSFPAPSAMPEALQKLREQMRQQVAASTPPLDQKTKEWQQSAAFNRIFPRAHGGEVHLAIGGQGPRNWMKGVEDVIHPMLETEIVGNRSYPHGHELDEATRKRIAELQEHASKPDYTGGAHRVIEHLQEKLNKPDVNKAAMNQWVQRNLSNYIRKQMATPNDPIRKLAEEGITHMPLGQMGNGQYLAHGMEEYAKHRRRHGGEQLGKSEAAKEWEDTSDIAMGKTTVGDLMRMKDLGDNAKHVEPWMEKADPNTELFHPTDNMKARYLGFDHLVDILKQDLAEGRIRPDQLSKVSIEHAVRRAHEYDQERKKKMAETALKATEGMPVHKEYPEGYKWIELALNPELPEGHYMTPAGTYVDPQGNQSVHHPNYAKLDDALKYEGDTMGHCVGGYTPDVVSGTSRIFSLRDTKNEPHVTIETRPHQHQSKYESDWFTSQPEELQNQITQKALAEHNAAKNERTPAEDRFTWGKALSKAIREHLGDVPEEIIQIKGKGNAKPKKDYIPYVQDFVKSGNWSHVGDSKNAEMIKHKGQYITHAEHDDWLANQLKPDQKAHGGIIHKAEGGSMDTPDLAQSRLQTGQRMNPALMDNIGINEALDMSPKSFISPDPKMGNGMPVGGVDKVGGLPIGGVDQSPAPGMQLAPQTPQQPQQGAGAPQGGLPPSAGASSPAQQPPSNILSLTPQGRALGAMAPQGMAKGGSAKQRAQARFAMEKQMAHLADGGQPPKRRTFAIQPANQTPKTEAQFTPYDPEKINIKNLARAFDEAIAHHLSLSPEDRIANSAKAAKAVGNYIGVNHEGKTKDLLGKNAKLLKTEKGKGEEPIELPDGRGVETTGLALAPAYEEAGFNTCPNSASCKKECLGKTSGNYFKLGGGSNLDEFEGPRLNSLLKTQAFLHDPHAFAVRLHDEIQAAKDMAGANGNHLGVRLNVLSDINPRVHKSIIHAHPDVTFYDYTKNNTDPIAPNHHYTYSSTGASQDGVENENTNWKQMRRRLLGGDNVAMAFSHKTHLPEHVHDEETGQKFRVIDGDSHDFRPMDMQPEGSHGVIVGLKNKKATGEMNKAHIDSHGFFLHFDPQEKMTTNVKGKPVYEREPSTRISPKTGKPMLGATIAQNKEVRIKPQNRDLALETNDGVKNEKA